MTSRLRLATLAALLLLFRVSALAAQENAQSAAPAAAPLAETRHLHAFPPVGEFEALACDFHMHTPYSDGSVSPRDRVLEAYRWGYDAIAITDHGKTAAYEDAVDLAEALGIVLIRGFETGIAKHEHLVVLGVPEGYTPRDSHSWAEAPGGAKAYYREQLEELSQLGAVVIYVHPHVGYRQPVRWGVRHGIVRGVEIKNGVVGQKWNTVLDHGIYWYPQAFDFATEHGLAVIADSDTHGPRPGNNEITYVFATERSSDGVVEAIRAGRTVASFDGNLWGPEGLLRELLDSTIAVKATADASGNRYVRITNRGPVALKAAVRGVAAPGAPIELGPYAEVLVSPDGLQGTLGVKWENVWTSPRENLVTSHRVR